MIPNRNYLRAAGQCREWEQSTVVNYPHNEVAEKVSDDGNDHPSNNQLILKVSKI